MYGRVRSERARETRRGCGACVEAAETGLGRGSNTVHLLPKMSGLRNGRNCGMRSDGVRESVCAGGKERERETMRDTTGKVISSQRKNAYFQAQSMPPMPWEHATCDCRGNASLKHSPCRYSLPKGPCEGPLLPYRSALHPLHSIDISTRTRTRTRPRLPPRPQPLSRKLRNPLLSRQRSSVALQVRLVDHGTNKMSVRRALVFSGG